MRFRDIPKEAGLFGSLRSRSRKKRRPTPFAFDEEGTPSERYRQSVLAKREMLESVIAEANGKVASAYVNHFVREASSPPRYARSDDIVPDDSISQIAVSLRSITSLETAESELPADIVADAIAGLEWLALEEVENFS